MATNKVTCKLISCGEEVTCDTGKVEVRAYQVKADDRKSLKVNWGDSGDAVFHRPCWTQLQKATKGDASDVSLSGPEVAMVKEANKTAEYHDGDPVIQAEAKRIVQMLKDSTYCIGFTGAGISTAAGIGDFRGKDGKWTEREKFKEHGKKGVKKGGRGYNIMALRPTYTHEAILKLVELGHLKYLISQNTDGLHRLSGIPEAKISELHGNAFAEKCENCTSRYERPHSYRGSKDAKPDRVPVKICERCRINHRTGRVCERKGCGGYLMNTIINFGDYLEKPVLDRAEDNAKKADLVLCLGTTLRVTPASDLVEMGHDPIRLVICNRQPTPYDNYCYLADKSGVTHGCRIFGDCDKLMRAIMLELLGPESVQEWEDMREDRMAVYDGRRR